MLLGEALAHRSAETVPGLARPNVREKVFRLTAEEARLRAQMAARLHEDLRQRVAREKELWALNALKVGTAWRAVSDAVREESLKEQLQAHLTFFRLQSEVKDAFVAQIDEQLDAAAAQQKQALRVHLVQLDRFAEFQRGKFADFFAHCAAKVQVFVADFGAEEVDLRADFERKRRSIEEVMARLRGEHERKLALQSESFQQMRDEIKDKVSEDKEIVQCDMIAKKMLLRTALDSLFQKFTADSKETFVRYTALLETNNAYTRNIEQTLKRIRRAKEKIKAVNLKVFQTGREFEQRNIQIEAENAEISKSFLALKEKMFGFRRRERERLTRLVVGGKRASDAVNALFERGKRILRNWELCTRLEFEEEKYLSSPPEEEVASREELGFYPRLAQFAKMRQLFKKQNKVLLENFALQKKNEELLRRNVVLRAQLSSMKAAESVSDEKADSTMASLLSTDISAR